MRVIIQIRNADGGMIDADTWGAVTDVSYDGTTNAVTVTGSDGVRGLEEMVPGVVVIIYPVAWEFCRNCKEDLSVHDEEHPGLCCDCFDLSWGMPLKDINKERFLKGMSKKP